MSADCEVDVITWVRKGLQYFHNMSNHKAIGVKTEMITEEKDGYTVLYCNQSY